MRYKVWHKHQETWVHDHLYVYIDPDGDVLVIDEGEFGIMYKTRITDDVEICRSTGLTDRNGKEIYEGDIVRWHGIVTYDYVIKFSDGVFCLGGRTDENFHHHREEIGTSWEVIGNVFQNPELLKGE